MERVTFEERNCSVARSLDILGDWWNVLIVLESMWGTSRFDDYQKHLKISKGILSKRLKLLQEHEVLHKVSINGGSEYRLTEKGLDLYVVVQAILQWGDKWNPPAEGCPVVPFNRDNDAELAPLELRDIQGLPVTLKNLGLRPGPGANANTRLRLESLSFRDKYR